MYLYFSIHLNTYIIGTLAAFYSSKTAVNSIKRIAGKIECGHILYIVSNHNSLCFMYICSIKRLISLDFEDTILDDTTILANLKKEKYIYILIATFSNGTLRTRSITFDYKGSGSKSISEHSNAG